MPPEVNHNLASFKLPVNVAVVEDVRSYEVSTTRASVSFTNYYRCSVR